MNLFKKRVLKLIKMFTRYCENRKKVIYSETPVNTQHSTRLSSLFCISDCIVSFIGTPVLPNGIPLKKVNFSKKTRF